MEKSFLDAWTAAVEVSAGVSTTVDYVCVSVVSSYAARTSLGSVAEAAKRCARVLRGS